MKKNTWNIRRLINESFVLAKQHITLKIYTDLYKHDVPAGPALVSQKLEKESF